MSIDFIGTISFHCCLIRGAPSRIRYNIMFSKTLCRSLHHPAELQKK